MGDPDDGPAANGGVEHAARTPCLAGRTRRSRARRPRAPPGGPAPPVVSGDAVDVVAGLKEESDVPLRSHGSLSLNRALMAAGQVELLPVTIFPVISRQTGTSPRLRDAADLDLELLESRTLDGRTVELIYRPSLH